MTKHPTLFATFIALAALSTRAGFSAEITPAASAAGAPGPATAAQVTTAKPIPVKAAPAAMRPETFEPYLEAHPSDETQRVIAMDWYSRREPIMARLQFHTMRMIEYHPANIHIITDNTAAFYLDPAYLSSAITHLEKQAKKGHVDHAVYWNLALIYQQGAIPPIREGGWSREDFLRHNGLPETVKLPETVNNELAEKAVHYYQAAMTAAGKNNFYISFYGEQMASLYEQMGRTNDALKAFQDILPNVDDLERANFLVSYGKCLRNANRTDEAVAMLSQVRACDKGGSSGGPGYATALAETELGLIALSSGKTTEASEHLMASCAMRPFTCAAMPLRLAKKLLDFGDGASVVQYCRTVLEKFAPGQQEAKDLLKRAEKAAG